MSEPRADVGVSRLRPAYEAWWLRQLLPAAQARYFATFARPAEAGDGPAVPPPDGGATLNPDGTPRELT